MNNFLEIFSYGFMLRALVAGVLIALSAGLIGVPLVLKRNAMIGDGLSHVGFAAIALATAVGLAPLEFALPVVIIVSFLIIKLNENKKINGDAAIALVSASALAIGVFLISVFGVNVDINSYLFGSILAVSEGEMILSIILSILMIMFYIIFYNRIFVTTFDNDFAKAVGVKTKYYEMIFAALCSTVVVIGMKIAGALLISSLIIFPVLTARNIAKSFWKVSVFSGIFAVIGFLIGLIVSYVFSVPTGATIVITNLLILVIVKLLYNK